MKKKILTYSKTQIKSIFFRSLLELVTRNPVFLVATGSDISRAVQPPPGTATEDGLKLEISHIVLRIGCMILFWHSLGLPYNYLGRKGIESSCDYVA